MTDQARRVALSYREALLTTSPEACAGLDRKFIAWDVSWVQPQLATVNEHEWVTVDVAADYTGLTAAAIYKWAGRDQRITGRKGNDGRLRVRVGDVIAANAERRRDRAERRS